MGITENNSDRGFLRGHLYHHEIGEYQADRMLKDLEKLPPLEVQLDNEHGYYNLYQSPDSNGMENDGLDASKSSLDQLLSIDVPNEEKKDDA